MATFSDLSAQLELGTSECLNAEDGALRNAVAPELRDDATLLARSDVDEELLFTLRFRALCRVNAFSILAPPGSGPARVLVFVNALGLDCSSASTLPPTQSFTLTEEDVTTGRVIPVHFVRFQKVDSLSFFVASNQTDAEHTEVTALRVFGTVVPNEGAAWAQSEELQEARKKGDWLVKGVSGS